MTHCIHPSNRVVYYSEIDDLGREYEEYWCADCNRWITPGTMMEIQERPDWTGGITEQDLREEKRNGGTN